MAAPSTARTDSATREALRRSLLATVPEAVLSEVLRGATCEEEPAGSAPHQVGDARPHCDLVVTGLARVYVTAPDGRTLTIRYCRSGALLGVSSLYHPRFAMPATVQAVTDVTLVKLRPERLRHATDRHPELARALLAELSERAMCFAAEIADGVFTTVPQRVARHLLDLAAGGQRGASLVAPTGQRELAEAVGSVREVVDRALRELRADGIIETGRRRVTILDPEALHDRAVTARSAR